jgi:hypothetical protein
MDFYSFQPPPFSVVRLKGLPFNRTDIDIFKFFAGLDIVDVLLVNKSGRFSGEAFNCFAGSMQVEIDRTWVGGMWKFSDARGKIITMLLPQR